VLKGGKLQQSNEWKCVLPGEIAALICLEAEYKCLMKGIRFMNHSPSEKTVPPIHDETKTPTRNTKSKDVINPSPAS
jgi:hypothetical protein